MTAGRKKKPTELKVIQGTFRKDRHNKHEAKPVGDLKTPPEYFSNAQIAEWTYVLDNAPKGLLKKIDLYVLELWVVACVFHREAVKNIESTGLVITLANGNTAQNPCVSIVNKQATIMIKAASEMGFTPASRSRVSVEESSSSENPFSHF